MNADTSLQMRLILLVLGAVLLFGLAAGWGSYKNTRHEVDEISDAQLAQFAQNLAAVVARLGAGGIQLGSLPLPQGYEHYRYRQTLAFQVWKLEKTPRLLLRSENASDMTKMRMPDEGFSEGEWRGEHWRYYRKCDRRLGLEVLVGENDHVHDEMAQRVAWHNITPFLFGLPVLMFFALLTIRFGLQPLRRLTDSLRRLAPERLGPVSLNDTPKEIAPVVETLNRLLERIGLAMENERRFTADASHELRTPLAALQAQVQAAQLCGNDCAAAAERNESLGKAMQGTERMGHLVSQLLTLSRLDEVSESFAMEDTDLNALAQECCAELGAAAVSRNIEIGFVPEASATLRGSPEMLRVLLRNLLDNAIRYTPPGGRIEVVLHTADAHRKLEISDSGHGVPDEQLALLGQRFTRLDPVAADGVGLGLSIVQRITEIHHAKTEFSRASLGGLSVTVCFPVRR